MTLDEFRQSLTATEPPAGLSHALAGLWWDAKGNWARANESAQQDEGVEGIVRRTVQASVLPPTSAMGELRLVVDLLSVTIPH